ncbi:MAG: creatininase family protein [Rhodothermaceae bacterium]|nr:creatininase family protein [Rhodothermaceae bacterium]
MKDRPHVIAETTWKTIQETPYEVIILPWGATEAHNYHLPYATDNIQCDHIAEASAKLAWEQGAKVGVLPTVPFGVNTGQLDIKLDINMYPSTQAAVLHDVIDSLWRQNIPKFVVMNGHGGNNFKQMLRELQVAFPDIFLCTLDWYNVIPWAEYFEDLGDHAGELETSVMMHISPHLVRPLSQAGPGTQHPFRIKALRERWAWAQREWSEASDDTGIGNPAKATEEKGARYVEAVTEKIASFLVDLAEADLYDLYEN